MADTVSDIEAENFNVKISDVRVRAVVALLPDRLDDVESVTLHHTVGNVEAKALVHRLLPC